MTSVISPPLLIEFHACQDAWRHPGVACIHHCLLRIVSDGAELDPKGLKPPFGGILARFAYLEIVVLETHHKFKTDNVQPLIEALREGCTVEVHHRTFDEAHKLALEVKKGPSHSTSAGLLSPLWCLQRFANLWDKW